MCVCVCDPEAPLTPQRLLHALLQLMHGVCVTLKLLSPHIKKQTHRCSKVIAIDPGALELSPLPPQVDKKIIIKKLNTKK
jgi:hypothetical protein